MATPERKAMSWSILVVDDSFAVRTQLRVPLEAKGARVLEAENGSEGLWRARENNIDLIIVDVHMPIMDGLRMIQELRKLPAYLNTPIFVLTSDAASTRVEEGRKAGASAWILKPVRPDALWKAIEKALVGRAPVAASERFSSSTEAKESDQ
jgi:two-component system, chemotaxis family, chemotaxis protein CheY